MVNTYVPTYMKILNKTSVNLPKSKKKKPTSGKNHIGLCVCMHNREVCKYLCTLREKVAG